MLSFVRGNLHYTCSTKRIARINRRVHASPRRASAALDLRNSTPPRASAGGSYSADEYYAPELSSPQLLMDECMKLVRRRDLDGLIHLLDSKEILAGIQPDVDDNKLDFRELLEAMMLLGPSRQLMDTYAIRNLVLSTPTSFKVLSTLSLPDRFIRRCAVTSRFGEECTLTFTLNRITKEPPLIIPDAAPAPPGAAEAARDSSNPEASNNPEVGSYPKASSNPAASNNSAASSSPEAIRDPEASSNPVASSNTEARGNPEASNNPEISNNSCAVDNEASVDPNNRSLWKLASIRGEPYYSCLPPGPSSEFSPESIVQAQLHCLKNDLAQAYCFLPPSCRRVNDLAQAYYFLSPSCRRVIGPWGPHRFARMLSKHE
eukprot:gene10587-12247_t